MTSTRMTVLLLLSALSFVTALPVIAQSTTSAPAAASKSADWQPVEVTGSFHPREEASFVRCGDRLYLFGGRGIQPIDIFDPKTRTWSEGAKPPIEIHHFQSVVWKGRIYVAGAMTGKYPTEQPIADILVYDPAKDQWSTEGPVPAERRRGGAGAVVYNGKLYLTAGIKNGHTDGWVNWFDSYDFATKKWTVLPDAPRARDHFEAAVLKGKLYAVGGRRSSYVTNEVFNLTIPEVDVWDFAKKTWSTLPAKNNLPTLRAGAATTVVGSSFIVVGGESATQLSAHKEVEAFDTVRQEWRTLPSLSDGRHGTGAPYIGGSMYTSAGAGNRGGSPLVKSTESFKIP